MAETPASSSIVVPAQSLPSADVITAKIKATEGNSTVTEEQKTRELEQYRAILSDLEAIKNLDNQAIGYRTALETAPKETAVIKTELKKIAADTPTLPTLTKSANLQEIEQLLVRERADMVALDAQRLELDKTIEDLQQQPSAARQRLTEVKLLLEKRNTELKQPLSDSLTADEKQIRQWVLTSQRERLRIESLMLEQQILSAAVRTELALAQRERNLLLKQQLQTRHDWLENAADRQRRAEAEQAQAETQAAERSLADAHPVARQLAKNNATLSERITELTEQLNVLTDQQTAIEREHTRIEQDFRSARQRLELVGLNHALGQVLIDQRNQLPEQRVLRKAAAERADIISETTLNQIRLREELRQLNNEEQALSHYLTPIPITERRATLRKVLREQLQSRLKLLQQSIALEDRYLRALSDLDDRAQQLLRITINYEQFLAERLLWVRSIVPITQQTFTALPTAIDWLIAPTNWYDLVLVLYKELKTSVVLWITIIGFSVLITRTHAIRRYIRATAEPLRRVSSDRFSYTLIALGWTVLLALPWSLLLFVIGWRLNVSLEATLFTKAIGQALLSLTAMLYGLRAFSLLCMSSGVADRHFRWHGDTLVLLRHTITWATWLLIPFGFIATAVYHHPDSNFSGTLGRLALITYMFILAGFTVRVAHPKTGAFKHLLTAHPTGWANRLRYVWYPIVVAVPLLLAVLALAGYLYTAGILLKSLVGELWLILTLLVVQQVIIRWLNVTRRSLALQAALDARATREDTEGRDDSAEITQNEEEIDFAALDEQTRQLVNSLIFVTGLAGLWAIWADMLPALTLFEHVTLWHYTGADSGQLVPMTLADLVLVLLIVGLAIIAARNLPALLEIVLLRHTSISAGSRYTLITLTGYSITAGGILFTFSTLGLSWSQVQWLVAALSVGIGFGLQEIVANFISGLIILFERPIRVGDVVTIGDITGSVTKINIRATTIRNWDRQELLVPNKEFITGRLLNWTLTDKINRLVVTVGIDYEADVRQALTTLTRIVEDNPRVLSDPAPLITFEGFGDNALILVLRCYLDSLEHRMAVTTELHQAIHDNFRAANIGIAYPQRDLHLHSTQPLEVRIITD
ncbi:mechanosensitive ion channel domain-containing protein [Thiospirillum jenense]|uniref:Mechanosensitive ion channel n=1 Tax=Thiospirillum jenense TaxID=1653858 RepID=A0A839HBH8_9GAMM|nr:mechanosensitive ion channel domain-containing protein [Thiospirillum jenense]MBB1126343.1 mechanosensitive ion channel [Thiospirillum jenense]